MRDSKCSKVFRFYQDFAKAKVGLIVFIDNKLQLDKILLIPAVNSINFMKTTPSRAVHIFRGIHKIQITPKNKPFLVVYAKWSLALRKPSILALKGKNSPKWNVLVKLWRNPSPRWIFNYHLLLFFWHLIELRSLTYRPLQYHRSILIPKNKRNRWMLLFDVEFNYLKANLELWKFFILIILLACNVSTK